MEKSPRPLPQGALEVRPSPSKDRRGLAQKQFMGEKVCGKKIFVYLCNLNREMLGSYNG